ncbi:MAG: AEC family transporter [Acidimicrobiales bacterium]
MAGFGILVVCLVLGGLIVFLRLVPARGHEQLDTYVIFIALPAIALGNLHAARFTSGLVSVLLLPYVLFACAALAYYLLTRLFHWPIGVFAALLVTAGIGNTSFVGLPMIQVFFGARWRTTGIVIDQLGTYLILSTIGITVAALCSGGKRPAARAVARRVASFPPFLAVCAAFALHPLAFPLWLQSGLSLVGTTLAPVALFSVGMQLETSAPRAIRGPLAAGLVAKLVVLPVLVSLVAYLALGDHSTATRVAMFEMAMPPAVGGAIVANRYGLAPPLPSMLVGVGVLFSFGTLLLWSLALHHL